MQREGCISYEAALLPAFICILCISLVPLDKSRFNVGGYCEVCKTSVAYIDSILEKNSTESQIEEAVRKVCSFLPESMQTEVRIRGGGVTSASGL